MKGNLNIYACTGFDDKLGRVDEVGRYHYWLNGTKEWNNTRAYNFLLAKANGMMYEIAYLEADEAEIAQRMNELDMYVVSLEALDFVGEQNSNELKRAGGIIGLMASEGMFSANFIDDESRAKNLDTLIADFQRIYNSDATYTTNAFTDWWDKYILTNTFNLLTDDEKERFEQFFSQTAKVSGDDENELNNFSEYVENAGDYYLYLFIPKDEIRKYNGTIQKRYNKELEMYQWCCDNCNGLYDEATVLQLIRNGLITHYRMTPEAKIAQLNELYSDGKVGEVVAAIISAVAAVLVAILTLITTIVQIKLTAKYSKPADEESGIPETPDWGDKKKSSTSTTTLLLIGGGLAAAYFLSDKDND